MTTIRVAIDADPDFAMGHCLQAALIVTSTDPSLVPMLAASIEAVEALGKRANDRERAHAAAARKWLEGDFAGSVRAYGDILLEYPRDLLALQVAHVGDFLLGASTMLRDRIAQVLPHWDASVPGYGYVLGMHAFGLEECACVFAGRGHRPARAGAECPRSMGGSRRRARHGDAGPRSRRHRLADGPRSRTGRRTMASRSTTGGIWRCTIWMPAT